MQEEKSPSSSDLKSFDGTEVTIASCEHGAVGGWSENREQAVQSYHKLCQSINRDARTDGIKPCSELRKK